MPEDEPGGTPLPHASRVRLRRSGRKLVRVGALLLAVALVVTLVSGLATRRMVTHLQTNSAELLDGSAQVLLAAGTERTLYVTGGLIAPGELVSSPLEDISCAVTGPDDQPVDFVDRTAEGVGIDVGPARIQVVGQFTAEQGGTHVVECTGRGVVLSPGLEPASVVLRLGGLAVGSLGVVLSLTMLVIGGVLLALRRDQDDDELALDEDLPPAEGAEEWWDGAEPAGSADPAEFAGDDYVEISAGELARFSDEEIEELVASGALVFEDDDEKTPDEKSPDVSDDVHGAPPRQP